MKLNKIINTDCIEGLKQLEENSVDLCVTSPPYNVSKDYDDDLSLDEYRSLLKNVWEETYRVLVPGKN